MVIRTEDLLDDDPHQPYEGFYGYGGAGGDGKTPLLRKRGEGQAGLPMNGFYGLGSAELEFKPLRCLSRP